MGGNSFCKIKAFTIIELVIALILTSLTVLLAYNSFGLIYSYISNEKLEKSRVNDSHFFCSFLISDWESATSIKMIGDSIVLTDKSKNLYYLFEDSLLIRIQGDSKDSLLRQRKFYKIHKMDSLNSELINSLKYSTDDFNVILVKNYTSKVLMNLKGN